MCSLKSGKNTTESNVKRNLKIDPDNYCKEDYPWRWRWERRVNIKNRRIGQKACLVTPEAQLDSADSKKAQLHDFHSEPHQMSIEDYEQEK